MKNRFVRGQDSNREPWKCHCQSDEGGLLHRIILWYRILDRGDPSTRKESRTEIVLFLHIFMCIFRVNEKQWVHGWEPVIRQAHSLFATYGISCPAPSTHRRRNWKRLKGQSCRCRILGRVWSRHRSPAPRPHNPHYCNPNTPKNDTHFFICCFLTTVKLC